MINKKSYLFDVLFYNCYKPNKSRIQWNLCESRDLKNWSGGYTTVLAVKLSYPFCFSLLNIECVTGVNFLQDGNRELSDVVKIWFNVWFFSRLSADKVLPGIKISPNKKIKKLNKFCDWQVVSKLTKDKMELHKIWRKILFS